MHLQQALPALGASVQPAELVALAVAARTCQARRPVQDLELAEVGERMQEQEREREVVRPGVQ